MADDTTVFALYKTREAAENALRALVAGGFAAEQVGMLGPGDESDKPYTRNLATGVGAAAGTGALAGGVIGAMAAGLIPGFGIVIATGTLLPVIVGVMTGASTGLVAGALVSMAASSEQALYYEQQVRAGSYLVAVTSDRPLKAREILEAQGGFEAAPV